MPVPDLKVDAETPESDHGDTADRPMPAPNAISSKVRAAPATAPAATAAHDTPEVCNSTTATESRAMMVSIGCFLPGQDCWKQAPGEGGFNPAEPLLNPS